MVRYLHLLAPELQLAGLSPQEITGVFDMAQFIVRESETAAYDPSTALQWCELSTREIVKKTGKSHTTVLKHLANGKSLTTLTLSLKESSPEKVRDTATAWRGCLSSIEFGARLARMAALRFLNPRLNHLRPSHPPNRSRVLTGFT